MTWPSFTGGDALDHHVLALDAVRPVDLGYADLGHDVHAGVLQHLGGVPSSVWVLGFQAQEAAVGLIKVGDVTLGLGDHHAALWMWLRMS